MRLDRFVKQILQREQLTTEDFKNYIRHNLAIEQLREAMGLTGELVTPQEAATVYERQHQELSAQIVFFSASNYLSSVAMTPAAVGQFTRIILRNTACLTACKSAASRSR